MSYSKIVLNGAGYGLLNVPEDIFDELQIDPIDTKTGKFRANPNFVKYVDQQHICKRHYRREGLEDTYIDCVSQESLDADAVSISISIDKDGSEYIKINHSMIKFYKAEKYLQKIYKQIDEIYEILNELPESCEKDGLYEVIKKLKKNVYKILDLDIYLIRKVL